ncbi:MAG: cytochrome c3 family protein [Anaerolineales bacterium]|jgi:predicted CXXCH cytochrome family protein
MKKTIFRLMIGLLFALPFGMVTVAWAQTEPPPPSDGELNCQECHPAFVNSWQNSSHGQATTDPAFEEAWLAQGEPQECLPCHTTGYDFASNSWEKDGIACEACHSPYPSNHPLQPMPSDRSSALCGECHTETYFEWQVSGHRETNLDCVDCHGQHSTTLKAEDASALCASCHRERASNFAHTAHSQEGLSCADCHLDILDSELGEGHAMRDHSFNVKLSTCNACHEYHMHDPATVHTDQGEPEQPEAVELVSAEAAGVSLDPEPVSPIYYALLSALIGMAFGLLVAPWIERWYRRLFHLEASE